MLHLNGADGATSTTDVSNSAHAVTFNGTAQLDTAIKKFGSASLLLDGDSDSISMLDSTDWDIFATTTESWTVDMWIYPTGGGDQQIIGQFEDSSNEWGFIVRTGGVGLDLRVEVANSVVILVQASFSDISDTWSHVCFVKIADKYASYLNGTQVAYTTDTTLKTYSSPLVMGRKHGFGDYYAGGIDEARVQNSNYFLAAPNVGLTDTITVPTSEYSTADPNDTYMTCSTANPDVLDTYIGGELTTRVTTA